jgi:hypothetical protein
MKTYQVALLISAGYGLALASGSYIAPQQPATQQQTPLTITSTDAMGHVRTGTETYSSFAYDAGGAITITAKHDTLTCNGFEP